MIYSFLTLFLAFLSLVSADISISTPSASQTYTVSQSGVTVQVKWVDDTKNPTLSTLVDLTIVLCTGAENNNIQAVTTLVSQLSKNDISDNLYSVDIPSSIGDDGVYYLQLYATFNGGVTIHYTNRFQLSGMTGPQVSSGNLATSPPPSVNNVQAGNGNVAAANTQTLLTLPADMSLSFTVPYPSQTGIIKFAPMQTQPGSIVTKTVWTRQYPTSSVTYYSSLRASLDCLSTVTPGWSYTRISEINWASPAPYPALDGSWYPAGQNILRPSIATTRSLSRRFFDLD